MAILMLLLLFSSSTLLALSKVAPDLPAPESKAPLAELQDQDRVRVETAGLLSLSLTGSGTRSQNSMASHSDGSEEVELPDLDYMVLANITAKFSLPKQAAAWCMGGLVFLTTIDNTIKKGFDSAPEVSIMLYCVLLGIFSSVVCDMYWQDPSRQMLWVKLGPYHALSGLFAQSMLLGTPLLLLIPNQNFAERFWSDAVQQAVTSCFESAGLKRVLLIIYLILVAFQVSSAYTFYLFAELQEKTLTENQVINVVKGQKSTSPLIMSILYLVLAWCNVATMYEFLFDASFADDFPRNVIHRVFGCEQQAGQQAGDGEEDGPDWQLLGVMRDATLLGTLADANSQIAAQGKKLLDSIKQVMPTSNALQCIHMWLYIVISVCILALIGVLEVRMCETAGVSVWSLLFFVLTILLEIFLCSFSIFASCGVKADRRGHHRGRESYGGPRMREYYGGPPVRESYGGPPVPMEFESRFTSGSSTGAKEHEIELALLRNFGSIVGLAFTSTTSMFGHSVIVVPKKGKESAVVSANSQIFVEIEQSIAQFVSDKARERDGSTFSTSCEVRVMFIDEYAAVRQAAAYDQARSAAFEEWDRLGRASGRSCS